MSRVHVFVALAIRDIRDIMDDGIIEDARKMKLNFWIGFVLIDKVGSRNRISRSGK